MIRIAHPTPSPGRVKEFGVEFVDGTAIVDELHPERELALVQHGFAVITEVNAVPLEDLTVPELRQIAEHQGIELPSKALKQDIIATLDGHPSIADGTVAQVDTNTTAVVEDTED